MATRYLSLWFRHLTTDYLTRRRPVLQATPFVFATASHGRRIITAANPAAQEKGVHPGMVLADARMLIPTVEVIEDSPDLAGKLLHTLALWAIRYTPLVAVDPPDGLLLDISGCSHLWGDEKVYFKEIILKLKSIGYDVRGAIADTIGAAWAIARFGRITPIIANGNQREALLPLSPAALRIDPTTLNLLKKLGFRTIGIIAQQPRTSLPRFGKQLLLRLDQAFGKEPEHIIPVLPVEPYQARLPCLEPIRTAGGIEIALTRLLDVLCQRLQQDGKGIRTAIFKGYRVDGKIEQISIGTTRATYNINHLFKLFELKIPSIEPDLGIELFLLEAPKVDDATPFQESLWGGPCGVDGIGLAELLDRLANKAGAETIRRYLPSEHYWPERSIKPAVSLQEQPASQWPTDRLRPFHILATPEPIEVTAPIPDYPPMLFRYKGSLHKIVQADGPERIENEWWIQAARHRDYYAVEDDSGGRYWIFRSGHYTHHQPARWFIHGFFA